MISVSNLGKRYGARVLFEGVNMLFAPTNRYGLTGPNGAGKSTFLKILQGDEEQSSGTLKVPDRIGILRQDQFRYDEMRVVDAVLMGNKFLWAALAEREELFNLTTLTDEQGMRLGELESIVASEDGYVAEHQAAKLLKSIGISEDKHEDKMKSLPTDLKFRVLLVQALFGKPEALLLDEPTNYLDLQSIQWLEETLKEYRGTLIVISHDRHFLNAVCNQIADIDYETVTIYPGNYDAMVTAKSQVRQQIEEKNKEKAEKVAQLQDFVARFGAGTRSSQTQSRLKEIDRLQATELKRSNIQRPYIRFEIKRPSGQSALKVEKLSKGYTRADGTWLQVIQDLSLEINRGDRVGIIGNNGLGKTTFLSMLAGVLSPDEGNLELGYEITSGYFPQDYKQGLEPGLSAYDWLEKSVPNLGNEVLRNYLGRMLFSGEEALKQTDNLSGGESARLILAKLQLEKNNLLLLDEPTNHLDLEAVSALSESLVQFPGTAIFASHDRDLISTAATKILAFTDTGIDFFMGNLEEYLFAKASRAKETKPEASANKSGSEKKKSKKK